MTSRNACSGIAAIVKVTTVRKDRLGSNCPILLALGARGELTASVLH